MTSYDPEFDPLIFFFLMADNQMFQYFITVVPTKLNTYKISADTHQFSVTERVRGTHLIRIPDIADR